MTAVAIRVEHPSGGAPWRPLAALAVLVLAAHGLVLQAFPERVGPSPKPTATPVFTTRNIALAPAVQAAQSALTSLTALTAPGLPPEKFKQKAASKAPQALEKQGQDAIDIVANSSANTSPDDADSTPIERPTPSTPVASTPTVATISPLTPPVTATPKTDLAPPFDAAATSTAPKPTQVTAIRLPGSARLEYKVLGTSKGLNYFADAELNWSHNGNHYDATMKVSALFVGSRSMTSSGAVTPTGLAPMRFADKYKNEVAAHFEADKGKVTFSANTPDVPWMEGAQDRVSVFLQLGGMLAAGPGGTGAPAGSGPAAFAVGSSISLYTVGPRDADTWTFIVEATEPLSLPGGDLVTLKLTRKPKREYDQKVEVWYAPSLGYLPVRNRITQANGDFIDQQLKTVTRP